MKKEILEKKKVLINEVHIGKRGNPLSMGKYNEAKGLYIVKCADGKQLTSVSEDGLIDALMAYYGLSLNSPLIKDIFERAIIRYERKHPDKSKTIYNYGLDCKRYLDNTFQKMDIRKISNDFLEDYSIALIREKNLKVSSFKNYKTLLNLIWEQAIFEGLTNENITKNVKVKDLACYCDQTKRSPEELLHTEAELQLIESDMWDKISHYYCPYAYMTLLHPELGCRPDELICLKWNDIDFHHAFIHIQRQQIEKREPKQSFEVKDYLKNEKGLSKGGRIVPLSSKALEILKKLRAEKEELGISSEWLFTNKQGELLKKKGYFDFMHDLTEKYGFTAHGSYCFRRELSSKLERAGIEPSERAEIMGHSLETNLRHYTFAKPDYLDRVKRALR